MSNDETFWMFENRGDFYRQKARRVRSKNNIWTKIFFQFSINIIMGL